MFGLFKKARQIDSAPIYFFNTATQKKELFTPLKEDAVTMYSCGPTVYDYVHIGNLRAYVFVDVLKRTLQYNGYNVVNTINLTDFGHLTSDADTGEDKMMIALRRAGKPITLDAMRDVAEPFIDAFKEDIAALNIEAPTMYARASDYVKEQIVLIKTLSDKGYTYETSDGLYFDISKYPKYGMLGNIDVRRLKEGARVDANPEKRHPADFALWKKGLLGWDSIWGKGFPGWHIECTAMVFATLGKQIDIHTGGIDHIGVHHNGEIAQAESATGKQYVRYWMHNAFITLSDKRIGKSEGNAIGLRQLKDKGYSPEVYRYWLLTGHYRSPMNFTFEALDGAKAALYRLKRHLFEEYLPEIGAVSTSYEERFRSAINDDLDTPQGVALLWEVVKDDALTSGEKAATMRMMDEVLALGLRDDHDGAQRSLGVVDIEDVPEEVQALLQDREVARAAKDWEEADRLREAINLQGYIVEDTAEGPRITAS